MRAYRYTGSLGGGHSLVHHQGVAGVIAAGHVGRGHMLDNLLIQTDGVCAKALAQVAVQIYLVHK